MASRMALVALAEADRRDAPGDCTGAHAHGPVVPARDAAAPVLDPCYRGTAGEEAARRLPGGSGVAPRTPAGGRRVARPP